jgi:uncharacterized protein (TIGR01777 family)
MIQPNQSVHFNHRAEHEQTRPLRLLITGANGMIGHALLAAAHARGTEAVPVQRPVRETRSKAEAPANPNTVLWEPEAAHPFADLELLEGFDAVVHLAGANLAAQRWTAKYKQTIRDSRTLTTGALALTLARLRQPPRVLLSASAIGFYGSRGEETLTEESAPGAGFLADVCQAWENAAAPAISAGMRVVNLRFGVVLTPYGGTLKQMLPLFRAGLGGKLGGGKQWTSWITLDDLLQAIFHTLEHDELQGPVNMVSPHPARNAEFTKALGDVLKRPALLPAPAFALRAAFGQLADEALLSSCRALPAKLQASGFRFGQEQIYGALGTLLQGPNGH